jgi:hypothetical protein
MIMQIVLTMFGFLFLLRNLCVPGYRLNQETGQGNLFFLMAG